MPAESNWCLNHCDSHLLRMILSKSLFFIHFSDSDGDRTSCEIVSLGPHSTGTNSGMSLKKQLSACHVIFQHDQHEICLCTILMFFMRAYDW